MAGMSEMGRQRRRYWGRERTRDTGGMKKTEKLGKRRRKGERQQK